MMLQLLRNHGVLDDAAPESAQHVSAATAADDPAVAAQLDSSASDIPAALSTGTVSKEARRAGRRR